MKKMMIIGAVLWSAGVFAGDDSSRSGVYLGKCNATGSGASNYAIQKYLILDLEQNFIHEGQLIFPTLDCAGKPDPFKSFNLLSHYTSFGMSITGVENVECQEPGGVHRPQFHSLACNQMTVHAKNANPYSSDPLTATYIFTTRKLVDRMDFGLIRLGHTQVINGEIHQSGADAQLMLYSTQKPLTYLRSLQ